MDLPGKEFAESHGYALQSYSGNGNSANYIKEFFDGDRIHLTCYNDGTAELGKILGLITCSTGNFSIPNKNFELFEIQLIKIVMI